MMEIAPGNAKDQAKAFLDGLQAAISKKAPPGPAMERDIRRTVAEAKNNADQQHLRLPEAAFLNLYAVPTLFEELQEAGDLTTEQAREALLNEYHHTMPQYSTTGPFRAINHPFKKLMTAPASAVYRSWKSGEGLSRCGPDFALRAPFPHRILFEGKYFAKGSMEYAGRELVKRSFWESANVYVMILGGQGTMPDAAS